METFKIENLTFTYLEEPSPAISNINLSVNSGDFLVICGHSGCGKSTFLRQLKKTISPYGKCEGSIYFHGNSLNNLSEKDMASKIGFIFQNPDSQIVTDKVWHELAFTLESLGAKSSIIRNRCAEMAAFFGIEDLYYKNISDLSGGQKQLVCLASVMTACPEVLILDEPTAQLDPVAAAEFISTLGKINREIGTTVILSEHRLEESIPLSNKIAVMENGKLLCCDNAENVGKFLKENNSAMFSAMPSAMRVWSSVETDLPCPITVNEGRNFLNTYLETHNKCNVPLSNYQKDLGEEKIKVSEAYFRYEKELPDVVKSLNFTAYSGELFCILGGNGSGKTTTLKLISGIKNAYRGTVELTGKVGFLPQDPKAVFVKKTVFEDLLSVLKTKGINREAAKAEISKISNLCRIDTLLNRHPYDLSGGEQQRAALAKILLLSPDILLLDEPTKGLDIPFKNTFSKILKNLKNSGVCIVMVSHDIEFCAKYADRCGLFFDGNLVSICNPRDFFSGNNFYTTAASRMAREIQNNIITTEDVISLIGGTRENLTEISEKAPAFSFEKKEKVNPKDLPLWRKICAALSAVFAAIVFIYATKSGSLIETVSSNGLTSIGKNQLMLYCLFIALAVAIAVFLGKKSKGTIPIQIPKEKRKLSKKTIIASSLILLLIPITLFIGVFYFEQKQYYVTSVALLIECMLPFFFVFEGRKPKARELVIVATLCALGIAGRAAFFMLPQFKPVMAITIIAGVAFGGETGFLVGAVTMLVSNMLFSQGPWTPWQMFAMGIIGFLSGILYKKSVLLRTKTLLCLFGIISAIIIYGGIMNTASALIWSKESLNLKILLSYYVTGFPLDAVHASATAVFLWFGAEPMLEKLERIKTKYGLLD